MALDAAPGGDISREGPVRGWGRRRADRSVRRAPTRGFSRAMCRERARRVRRLAPRRRDGRRCVVEARRGQKEKNLRASTRKIRPVGVIARRARARSLESRTVEPSATRSIGPRDASRVSKTRVARSIAILAKPIPGLGFPVLTDRAARIASAQTDAVAVSNKSSARREIIYIDGLATRAAVLFFWHLHSRPENSFRSTVREF